MNDDEIARLVKGNRKYTSLKREPDYIYVHNEMQKKNVTEQLLWEEYCLSDPSSAYGYSSFAAKYRKFKKKLDLSMRQSHYAGYSTYVDFAGTTIPYTDPDTGNKYFAQIFIGVLGCSKYTFGYAVRTQSIRDWIDAHNKMYHFFGGTTQLLVSDNLKAAVIRPGSQPILNRTYLEQSKHYNIVLIPARVRRPKDKADAEIGVLIFSRWITARLRNYQFFSIDEINLIITELLEKLNKRPFKKLPGCRRSRFEEFDKPMLRPLPNIPFEYAEWTSARKLGPDYHLPIDKHYYSIPHVLVGERIETRATKNIIEFISKGKRIASHSRSYVEGGRTTTPAHQPKSHRQYANLTQENMIKWARKVGDATLAAVKYQFSSRPHEMLGIKSCVTLKRLAKDYGDERFEAACHRAQLIGSFSVKSIKSILRRRLTEFTDEHMPIQINLPLHENVRGSNYYMNGGE
jgi:transposase